VISKLELFGTIPCLFLSTIKLVHKMFYHSLPSRLRKHMVYGNMSANSDLQLEENRITQIFGTLLEKKIAPPTTLFSHKYVYITNLHKMEKR